MEAFRLSARLSSLARIVALGAGLAFFLSSAHAAEAPAAPPTSTPAAASAKMESPSASSPSPKASSSKVVSKPVAVVNNEPIFQDELEREAEPFIERYQKTTPEKDQTEEKIA